MGKVNLNPANYLLEEISPCHCALMPTEPDLIDGTARSDTSAQVQYHNTLLAAACEKAVSARGRSALIVLDTGFALL